MANSMKIFLSKYDKKADIRTIGQKVGFINVINGTAAELNTAPFTIVDGERVYDSPRPPEKMLYNNEKFANSACLLNYYTFSDQDSDRKYSVEQGFSSLIQSNETSYSTVFKQEIRDTGTTDKNGNSIYEELTPLLPVDTQVTKFKFRDFNVSNDRLYKYILYPYDKTGEQSQSVLQRSIKEPIAVKWSGWSITELHPVDGTNKKFTATPDDVWVFNFNISTGEQSQNISRQEQQTLGQFNRYSQGRMNYVTGSVSCLLGSDVLPASYIIKNKAEVNEGGYQEIRKNDKSPSSNQRVDMLLAWRKVVMSSNPKLLKDRAGQSFLVTLSNTTNKPMDAVYKQPNTISFTWTQIGNAQDVQIVGSNL